MGQRPGRFMGMLAGSSARTAACPASVSMTRNARWQFLHPITKFAGRGMMYRSRSQQGHVGMRQVPTRSRSEGPSTVHLLGAVEIGPATRGEISDFKGTQSVVSRSAHPFSL